MKYDDASWHSVGNFPDDLLPKAGATHIGMFVTWAILAGLSGDLHLIEFPDGMRNLWDRNVTPGAFLLAACDGKFTGEDLNEEGNAFAASYYELREGYLADYSATFGEHLPTLYHVPDTWESFDRIAPLLDHRFRTWRQRN